MSNRPFVAARLELAFDRRVERFFRRLGWAERVIPYTAYGTDDMVRVLGRVVLTPRWDQSELMRRAEEIVRRRGWRNFFTAVTVHARYTLRVGDTEVQGTTDRGGYIDQRIPTHGLPAGWGAVEVTTDQADAETVRALIVPSETAFGIISDIDDTILWTMLPRPFIAAWNSFIRTESARQAIPGMAVLYRDLLERFPGAPVIYLSTGAWNTHGFLRRFMRRHRYPEGPMLLTDWGPTNTGWFRSGQAHKSNALLQLSVDFPNIRWLLVGDDGQHDPDVYGEFARNNPRHVRAIAIRQLSPAEQILAHGTTEPIEDDGPERVPVPVFRASDGRGLHRVINAWLAQPD